MPLVGAMAGSSRSALRRGIPIWCAKSQPLVPVRGPLSGSVFGRRQHSIQQMDTGEYVLLVGAEEIALPEQLAQYAAELVRRRTLEVAQ